MSPASVLCVCAALNNEPSHGLVLLVVQDLIGSAFVVGDNPHAEATCGCKRSFTLK
jgi:Fe-S cluster assembly iron-binding protein IscA